MQGKPAAFDFSITSPLNSPSLSEAGMSIGVTAQASEISKHNTNHGKSGQLRWVFIPLACVVHGVIIIIAVTSFLSHFHILEQDTISSTQIVHVGILDAILPVSGRGNWLMANGM